MSKALALALVGILAMAGLAAGSGSAAAADLPIPTKSARATGWCGPCGCLHVTYTRHRELLTTYGTGFDPRNYDTQEPHYFYGAVRAYPRYWVSADRSQ